MLAVLDIKKSADAVDPREQGATDLLAGWLAADEIELPQRVRAEARRTFMNWLGCAIGGARHPAADIAARTFAPYSGKPESQLLGRDERMDPINAALVHGIASHVFDFDDTHLRTVIHPAGPVASALLAFAGQQRISGPEFILALVLGVEVECRIGNAVFPAHYDVGWHITGSVGPFGAAAAMARILKLDVERTKCALGLAATQPVGLREMFGSMTKSFHPGRAAQNGMVAALLAAGGYTSSPQALEARRGWLNVLSTSRNLDEITDQLGKRYQILDNTYKPYACGVVTHPIIDGCVQLRERHAVAPDAIESIELLVHPLVVELTGKTSPTTGLEGKFSVYHCAAVGLIFGKAGPGEFSDEAVADPSVAKLRERISATVDPSIRPDEVRISVRLKSGRHQQLHVAHALGSLENPMSERDLVAKFHDLVDPILGQDRADLLINRCNDLDATEDIAVIAGLCKPS